MPRISATSSFDPQARKRLNEVEKELVRIKLRLEDLEEKIAEIIKNK